MQQMNAFQSTTISHYYLVFFPSKSKLQFKEWGVTEDYPQTWRQNATIRIIENNYRFNPDYTKIWFFLTCLKNSRRCKLNYIFLILTVNVRVDILCSLESYLFCCYDMWNVFSNVCATNVLLKWLKLRSGPHNSDCG